MVATFHSGRILSGGTKYKSLHQLFTLIDGSDYGGRESRVDPDSTINISTGWNRESNPDPLEWKAQAFPHGRLIRSISKRSYDTYHLLDHKSVVNMDRDISGLLKKGIVRFILIEYFKTSIRLNGLNTVYMLMNLQLLSNVGVLSRLIQG